MSRENILTAFFFFLEKYTWQQHSLKFCRYTSNLTS